MSKKIIINNCKKDCPHYGHRGAYGKIPYMPCCGLTRKDLGYSLGENWQGQIMAIYDGTIPEWCPLEDNRD